MALCLHLFRTSRKEFSISHFGKLFVRNDRFASIKNIPATFYVSDNKFHCSFSKNTPRSLLTSKLNSPTFQDQRNVSIPPKNKAEFNELLEAFKKELSKFSVADLKQSPKTHLAYGAGGLIPFFAPTLQMALFGYTDGVAWIQLAYAATILSYLGGIQWGATIPDSSKSLPSWETLGLSVAPQLVAWIGLLFPTPLGLLTTSTALTATLAVDLLKHNYPPWFKSLRIFLTFGAVSSLVLSLFGSIIA